MRIKRRSGAVLALVATTVLVASGCSSGSSDSGTNTSDLFKNPVTIQWWHNANQAGPLQTFWQKVADDFHKLHPTVTIKISAIETNDLQRNRIPAALLSGNPPDLFQSWGGGEIADQVKADYLKDITAETKDTVASIGPAANIWAVNGKQYALPFDFAIEGFWYNKEIFAKAGITSTPTTLDELNQDITKLKGQAGIAPVSVGAGDKWPAAHYWYNFAVRDCSANAITNAATKQDFTDSCFLKAGDDTKTFIGTKPFQTDFLATPGQQGANSSAGLLANGKAAMELMGAWDPGTMLTLTPDQKEPSFLGWFPFPSISGAPGGNVQMGGGDGFACSKKAPAECVELLKYIDSPDVQKAFAATGAGIPVVKGAETGLSDPVLQVIAKGTQSASSVDLWLDTQFGSAAGTAMNDAIVAIFAGSGTSQGVVDALKKATSR